MNENAKETDFQTEVRDRLMLIEINVRNLSDQMEELALKAQKLEIAYYAEFPDRVNKDLRFENQVLSLKLNLPPEDDTTPKKS